MTPTPQPRRAEAMSERKRRELLLLALAEEGASRCCYLPGSGDPLAWPKSRCDCKYLGPLLHQPDRIPPMGELTGCCEMHAAYRVVEIALAAEEA